VAVEEQRVLAVLEELCEPDPPRGVGTGVPFSLARSTVPSVLGAERMTSSQFARVQPGPLTARYTDRKARLQLEGPDGRPVGAVALNPPPRLATVLEGADGTWTVRYVDAVPRHRRAHLSVIDPAGNETATVDFEGRGTVLRLPGGTLTWEDPALLSGTSGIDGLFVVRSSVLGSLKKMVPLLSRGLVTAEVTERLTSRPDASLVVLLAAWFAYEYTTSSGE